MISWMIFEEIDTCEENNCIENNDDDICIGWNSLIQVKRIGPLSASDSYELKAEKKMKKYLY